MLSALTGTGLSAAAGLNAYIPLLLLGLVARYTDLLPLGDGWRWLENPITLVVLGSLLVVEFLADKFPVVDSVNDVVQSFVRPTSGGVTFGAGASSLSLQEVATAQEAAGDDGSLWPLVAGAVIALALHVVKALARPVINLVTAGIGGAVTSLAEDFASLALAVFAVVIPIAIVLFIPVFVYFVVWVVRKRRERGRANGTTETGRDVPFQQPPWPPH